MDILQIPNNVELLTTETLKRIHSKMMKTSKVKMQDGCTALHYINAGCTRQTSQRTVVVRSQQYNLAFCPAERVDQQLDYICKMGRQYIARWRNPFATAAWLHVTFVRCHPFDDGNGRMSRLISSIPLLRHGLPPLCITPAARNVYYDSMNIAWDGDFQPLINCFAESMRSSLTEVEKIMTS
ncbi:fido domain-containing protein [Hygrophoropsis aurantiaca]|uniref:Fido domain-containing protein n=1 Tax=Hygrophoropsis aurantiaca TaxID=72124 RepID=A0ACB8AP07_9AGAM|nr:fido domain-containing protein [Hygrophoropsis aurantiaca]